MVIYKCVICEKEGDKTLLEKCRTECGKELQRRQAVLQEERQRIQLYGDAVGLMIRDKAW